MVDHHSQLHQKDIPFDTENEFIFTIPLNAPFYRESIRVFPNESGIADGTGILSQGTPIVKYDFITISDGSGSTSVEVTHRSVRVPQINNKETNPGIQPIINIDNFFTNVAAQNQSVEVLPRFASHGIVGYDLFFFGTGALDIDFRLVVTTVSSLKPQTIVSQGNNALEMTAMNRNYGGKTLYDVFALEVT